MFTDQNVEAYLKSIALDVDGEKRMAKMRLFITPIQYELAAQVDASIARVLFRANGIGYKPAQELSKADFAIRKQNQALTYKRHPEYKGHHVFIPHVETHTVSAQKLTPGDVNFSLLFTAEFEILDKAVITDLIDLLKSKIFVSFSGMQPELFGDPVFELTCRLCGAREPEFATTDAKFAYCDRDRANHQEGETLRRIREPKKKSESQSPDPVPAPAEEEKPPIAAEGQSDQPIVDGSFINQRAKEKKRADNRIN